MRKYQQLWEVVVQLTGSQPQFHEVFFEGTSQEDISAKVKKHTDSFLEITACMNVYGRRIGELREIADN